MAVMLAAASIRADPGPGGSLPATQHLSVVFGVDRPGARPIFRLYGIDRPRQRQQPSDIERYDVTGELLRLPCRGVYNLISVGFFWETWMSLRFEAEMRIRPASRAAEHACGTAVGKRLGARASKIVVIPGSSTKRGPAAPVIEVALRRRSDGRLAGRLTRRTLVCGGRFVFELRDRLRTRRYAYSFEITRIETKEVCQ